MKHFGLFQTAACAALLFAALSPRAVRADGWDKKTLLTFSDTVQVPGATLPAGTYVFKLAESNADRYIVQIFNERESHIYATALVIPDIHLTPVDNTLVMFYESPVGQPRPVKAWFYPGDNIGREFVYPKHEAALIAAAGKETVPSEQTYGSVAATCPRGSDSGRTHTCSHRTGAGACHAKRRASASGSCSRANSSACTRADHRSDPRANHHIAVNWQRVAVGGTDRIVVARQCFRIESRPARLS
jgi:hypothetical protein